MIAINHTTGLRKKNFVRANPSNPRSLQATADRQADNADRAEMRTSPRLQAFQSSGTQDTGNGTVREWAESEWITLNKRNDHVRFGEHKTRSKASRSNSSFPKLLSKQVQQDREMAEELVRDEELAASLQDLEYQARSRDEASLMLAIQLAEGFVQDYDAFMRRQTECVDIFHVSQRENDSQELQLQADRELALRLQNESSTMVNDNGLGGRIQDGPSGPRGRKNERGAQRQQTSPKEALRKAPMRSDNVPLYEYGWVDNAQRSDSTGQGMSIKDRHERQLQLLTQPFDDRAYAQQLQQELNQQEQWHIEAQRLQETIAAEDRQMQAKIEAERADLKRQQQQDCLICTDAYEKAGMVRPCQHWYCRPCLTGEMSHTWLSPAPRWGKVSLIKE